MTPPPGFLTPPHIPNANTNERPPVTTTVFAATTPGNTPIAYRAFTLTDPNPMISLAFVEGNNEILEFLLRDRRRRIRNEDLQIELEYFSEYYDEECEMELRPERTRGVTPPLRTSSPRIEDYLLPDGLKMPSHVGSYDGKGDPDNFLHLFEGAIHMQKWLILVASRKRGLRRRTCQFTASNKEKARALELSPLDLPSTYKGLMEKTYTWIKAREVPTNRAPNDRSDNFEGSRKSSWDNGRGQKNKYMFSLYWGPNHGLLSSLSKSLKKILAIEKGSRRKGKKHPTANEEKRKKKNTTSAGAPILMINREEADTRNSTSKSLAFIEREITFPPVTKGSNSLAPIVLKAKIFRREVGRYTWIVAAHAREKFWAIGEVLLEITIGDTPLSRSKTLNFVIVSLGADRNTTARKEVEELTRAGILREAVRQTWVANPVMVNKSDGGWRMCVDFTDINKACPKDCYPLSDINWMVESLSGFHLKCFMDDYKAYHQI
nr:reverse transcriptase domain-containing protein [Tanacetum cinerariifolium]